MPRFMKIVLRIFSQTFSMNPTEVRDSFGNLTVDTLTCIVIYFERGRKNQTLCKYFYFVIVNSVIVKYMWVVIASK